jgi:hypothetical protein
VDRFVFTLNTDISSKDYSPLTSCNIFAIIDPFKKTTLNIREGANMVAVVRTRWVTLSIAVWAVILSASTTLVANDWPTYRGDNSRTGATSETIAVPLQVRWEYASPAPIEMAWSSAEGRVIEGKLLGHRVKFDDAIHPCIV